eukprot:775424_1
MRIMGNEPIRADSNLKKAKKQEDMPSFKKSQGAGAGLEWRAFVRYELASKLDIFTALQKRAHRVPMNSWNAGYIEKRTDNYVVLRDSDYGLKFRYTKHLELKCRIEHALNIEGWYKKHFPIRIKEMKLSLLRQLTQKYKNDSDLNKCMQRMTTDNSFIVSCQKERQCSSVDGLSLEQTKCVIDVLDSEYCEKKNNIKDAQHTVDVQSLNGSEWISICVEGYSDKDVPNMLNVAKSIEQILCELDKNYIVASYPDWLIEPHQN